MEYKMMILTIILLGAALNYWKIIEASPEMFGNGSSTRPLAVYNKFLQTSHGVKSGNLTAINIKKILIPNFYYEGGGTNDVYFLVGRGKKPNGNGTVVTSLSTDGYVNENVTIELPFNVSLWNIDWISVWSVKDNISYGFVLLDQELPLPQTFGFASETTTSGPIVIINKKTLFIPNLRFFNKFSDAHFWVGNGIKPDSHGTLVADENGSINSLHSYFGKNIYLHLPNNLTTDNINYLAIWERALGLNLGHVMFNNVDNVPINFDNELETVEGKTIFRIPKCCPFNSVLSPDGCKDYPITTAFHPPNDIKIFEHNETHLNTDGLDINNFSFKSYIYSIKCPWGRYPLDSELEEYALLLNGSLIVRSRPLSAILSQGEYCIETIKDETGNYIKVLVCAPEQESNNINQAVFNIYISFNILSTLCFAGAFCLFYFILKCKMIHKKCFMAYCLFMAITFVCLTIVQVGYVESWGCTFLGYSFQFSSIASFTWLAILCFDILFMIIYFTDDAKQGIRFYVYAGISFLIPIFFLLLSLRNLTPGVPDSFFKPQFGMNKCFFSESDQRPYYFYIPVFGMIFLSLIFLTAALFKMREINKNESFNYFWIEHKSDYKYMFMQCYLAWILNSICWILDIVASNFNDMGGIYYAMVLLQGVQGVIIVAVFLSHFKYTNRLRSRSKKTVQGEELANLNSDTV